MGHDEAETRAPFNRWLAELAPRERVALPRLRGRLLDAIVAGAGIGFVRAVDRRGPGRPRGGDAAARRVAAPLWLVTHVDLHRTAKIQAFLALLKERARDWA